MTNRYTKSLLGMIALMAFGCTHSIFAIVTEKEKKDAKAAYENLLKIRLTTNKKNRLKDLEQLGALLIIDALDEIKYVKGKSVEQNVNNIKKQLQSIYNTEGKTTKEVNVAHQWIIGKIGPEIINYNKFASLSHQPSEDAQSKLDNELNVLKKDFNRIKKAIVKDLGKETMLPFIDDIKVLYGPEEDCPVCLENKHLIQFADGCKKPHICLPCKKRIIKDAIKKGSKIQCPVCSEGIRLEDIT